MPPTLGSFALEAEYTNDWYISFALSFWFILVTAWTTLVIPLSNEKDSAPKQKKHGGSQDSGGQVYRTPLKVVVDGIGEKDCLQNDVVEEGDSCTSSDSGSTSSAISIRRTSLDESACYSDEERDVQASPTKHATMLDPTPVGSIEAEIIVETTNTHWRTEASGVVVKSKSDSSEKLSAPKKTAVPMSVRDDIGLELTSTITSARSSDLVQDLEVVVRTQGDIVHPEHRVEKRGNAKMWLSSFKLVGHHHESAQTTKGDKIVTIGLNKKENTTVRKVLLTESTFQKELRARMAPKAGMPRKRGSA